MAPFIPAWWVRASRDAAFAAILVLSPAFIADALAQPAAPVPISPSGPTTNPNPNYTWNAAAGGNWYFVQVGDGVAITVQGLFPAASVCSGSTCAVNLAKNLSAGVNYWWAVQAKSNSGPGGTWGPNLNFTVLAPPAPALLAPSGPISNPTPTYYWNPSSGATQYYLQVSNGSALVFQGLWDAATVCPSTPCAVAQYPALTIGSYTWAVQAKNAAGGTWSPTGVFSVQGPPAPTLGAPSGAIGTPTPTYNWNPSSGATQYYVQVSNGSTLVFQGLYTAASVCPSSCAVAQSPALAIGSYTWAVQAQTAAGGTWSATGAFSVQAPPAPTLSSPSGAVSTSTPTFTWSASSGATAATSYLLQVTNGVTNLYQLTYTTAACSGATCSATPATALTAGSYSWSVKAINAAGSTWSSSLNFTYGSAPAAPTLISPTGPMTAVSPSFSWTVSTGATSYYIQVLDSANVSKYQNTLNASQYCAGGQCLVTPGLNNLVVGGDYTWSVTAQNTAGSAGSLPASFTVFGCGGDVKTGDFDGDGFTDRLCVGPSSVVVSRGTAAGFATGTAWLSQTIATPLIADFNSDGRADIAKFDSTTAVFSVAISNGSGFAALQNWGTANTPQNCTGTSAKADIGDFNGDGRPDVSCKLSGSTSVFVGISNGSSFTFAPAAFGTGIFCEAGERTGTIDVNGDGKSDWYCLGQANNVLMAFLSTGTSLTPTPTMPAISVSDSTFCDDADIFFGDFNTDGKTDVSCRGNGRVRLSTGSSYLDIGGQGGNWCIAPDQPTWPFAFAADVDGDGVPEMVCNGSGGGQGLKVRKWLGASLGPEQSWATGFCGLGITVGDFNGDGKVDILCNKNGSWASAGTVGTKADLMSQSSNGLDGTTTIAYLPSTSFPNGPGVGPRPLVRTVTTSDGRSGTSPSTTTYTYAGGNVNIVERMFLGFQSFRVDLPCLPESGCPYTVTTSSQRLASAGKPDEVQRYDGGGTLVARQTYQYPPDNPTIPRKSLLTRTDSYTYDSAGGSLHTYATYPGYDAYGNVTQTITYGNNDAASTDDLQTDTTFVPNAGLYIVGLPAQVERRVPNGAAIQTEQYEYDGTAWTVAPTKGSLTAVSRKLNQPNKTVTRRMTYDAITGGLLTARDETDRGPTTVYETTTTYKLFPAAITNAAGDQTTFTWDNGCAAILSTTDPNAKTTTQTYDNWCRPSVTTDPVGGFVSRTYLNFGDADLQRARTETNPAPGASGNDWSEAYFDGFGRTYKTVKRGPAAGQEIVTQQAFNARGGVASSTEAYYAPDGPQRTTTFEYDSQDRQTKTTFQDSNDITTSYGVLSQTVSDPNGKTVTTRVNGLVQEVERLWNGSPSITTTTYDILGRPITLQDAKTHTWTYAYDSLNRQRQENDPDAGQWLFDYDDAGRPTKQTDAKGQVTTMTYDAGGRLATKTSPTGTVTYTYSEAEPGYFNVGRLTTIASPVDTLELDYDALGRTKRQRRTINGTTYEVIKTWDSGGYLLGTKYPDNDTVGTTSIPLGYDQAGRLKSIPNLVSNITYDAAGRPTQKTNAGVNNAVTTWTYNGQRAFLEGIVTTSSAGTLQNLTYGYDAAGLVRTSTQQLANATGGTLTQSWTYGYDSFDHLTSATDANTSANSQTWNYDEIDRILSNSQVGTYQYPLPGQPRPHAPKTLNNAPPDRIYDLNGNLTNVPSQTLQWNGDNRLEQTIVNGTTTSFAYDSVGERIAKVSGSIVSIYPFGDDYEVRNGTITKYISVEGLGVVAKKVGTTPFWLHTDRLGSIQVVTNSSGSPQLGRTYRPYGETLTTNGSHTEFRGWIDQRNDSESGFTYLHARYFDPKLGQFLSPDPIGAAGGLNQYAYGVGDPINETDRDGTYPCPPGTPVDLCFVYNRPGPGGPGGGGFYVDPNSNGNLGDILRGIWDFIFGGPTNSTLSGPDLSHPPAGPPPMAGNPKQGPPDHHQGPPPIHIPIPPQPPTPQGPGPVNPFIGGALSSVGDSVRSIGLGLFGSADYFLTGNSRLTNMAYDVGPLGQTVNADGFTYYGTRGALVASGLAISGAGYGLGVEAFAAQGHFGLSTTIANRASMPFLRSAGSRWFSEMQARQLIGNVPRMGNYAGRTPLINWLTTARYAQPGGGDVVLNWWTRTIIHANPF